MTLLEISQNSQEKEDSGTGVFPRILQSILQRLILQKTPRDCFCILFL